MAYQDFVGFTLDGIHSSTLGIIRTSDGNGFTFNPLPSTREYTTKIVGRDGERYWGREFGTTTLDFTIAYDNLTEANMRKLQKILKKRNPISLIFDEAPYKVYYALPTNSCRLDYVCFATGENSTVSDLYSPNIGENGRIYKGEGTLKFNIYEPYAHCGAGKKYIDDTYYNDKPNKVDWNPAVKLSEKTIEVTIEGSTAERDLDTWYSSDEAFYVYNPGDKSTPPIIHIPFTYTASGHATITIKRGNTILLQINDLVLNSEDSGIEINNELQLIRGWTGTAATSNIYNGYIAAGYFFTIDEMDNLGYEKLEIIYSNTSTYTLGTPTIEYDYLYL